MSHKFIVLFVVVNVLILAVGGFLVYSDLYIREDTGRYHENTTLVDVEYSPFAYRPTYQYYELDQNKEPMYAVVTEGSWTLDFFQLSIIAVIASSLYIYLQNKRSD